MRELDELTPARPIESERHAFTETRGLEIAAQAGVLGREPGHFVRCPQLVLVAKPTDGFPRVLGCDIKGFSAVGAHDRHDLVRVWIFVWSAHVGGCSERHRREGRHLHSRSGCLRAGHAGVHPALDLIRISTAR